MVHAIELFSLRGQGKIQTIDCPGLLHSHCRDSGTTAKVTTFCRWSDFSPLPSIAFYSLGQGLHHNFSHGLSAEAGFLPIPSSWHRQAEYSDICMEDICCSTTTKSQIAVNPLLLGVVESIVVSGAIIRKFSGPSSSAQTKSIWFKPNSYQRLRNPQLLLQTLISQG